MSVIRREVLNGMIGSLRVWDGRVGALEGCQRPRSWSFCDWELMCISFCVQGLELTITTIGSCSWVDSPFRLGEVVYRHNLRYFFAILHAVVMHFGRLCASTMAQTCQVEPRLHCDSGHLEMSKGEVQNRSGIGFLRNMGMCYGCNSLSRYGH